MKMPQFVGMFALENSIIAPDAFVNFNVPQDSIVIGNSGVIHKKQKE